MSMFGKISVSSQGRSDAEDQDQHRHDDEGVRTPKRELDDADHNCLSRSAAKQLLDINTATEDELRALKGIGDIRAANIIKNRPYKGKDELVQKNIIPAAVYAGIKDKIIAKQQ
jgi:hypothetical protein